MSRPVPVEPRRPAQSSRAASATAALLVLGTFFFAACSSDRTNSDSGLNPLDPSPPAIDAGRLEQEIYGEVNSLRASRGLASLAWSNVVAEQARQHSSNMASGKTPFSHDGFDERRAAIAHSLSFGASGEVVARTTATTAAAVVGMWLQSNDHRAILEGGYNLVGVGIASQSSVLYCTAILVEAK